MEIKRNGHIVKIILDDEKSKLDNLVKHDCIVGDPEELVGLSSQKWGEERCYDFFGYACGSLAIRGMSKETFKSHNRTDRK